MPLPTVGIVLGLYDGTGNPITAGSAVFTPTTSFAGTDGIEEFVAEPVTVQLGGGSFPVSAPLLPTDLPTAPAWAWQVSFTGVNLASFTFFAPAGPVAFTGATGTPGVVTWTATSALTKLPAGTAVKAAGGSLPAGLTAGTTYYVLAPAGQTLGLSATPGGSAIAFTGTGSGTLAVASYYLAGLTPVTASASFSQFITSPLGNPAAGSVPVSTGSGSQTAWKTGAFAAALTPTALKAGAYTAAAGDLVLADASSGTVPVTLPAAPADKTVIAVKAVKLTQPNTVTVTRGGSDTFNGGTATVLTLSQQARGMTYQYDTALGTWIVTADDSAGALPGLTQVAVSAAGALAADTLAQVNATSGPLTMTLPAPAPGQLITVEKSDSSVNAVTLSGNIRGSATTVKLSLQYESAAFYAYGSTWYVLAGHKTLSSLDSRYAARTKVPFITVSPVGTSSGTALPNNGMDFGPDTAGTTTQGLQEAVTYAIAQVSGLSGTLAPPTLLLGPGPAVFEISSTINIPVPTGVSGNGIGFGIMGAGHLSTKVRFHAGAGFLFGKYGWQDVVFQDMCIESANGGTQTSLIAVTGGSSAFPTFRSEMMLERVWFETPVALGSLPANGCIYFGPDSVTGFTGGWDLYVTGCVVAAGSFSITTPYDVSFLNTLVNSGPAVQFGTNSPIVHISSSEITGQIVLTGVNQRLRIDKCYWNEIPATNGAVSATATTGTTCVTIRDSTVNLLGTGPVVKQASAVVEMHFECNSMFVASGGNYAPVGGGAQLSHTSTIRGNHPDGFLGAPAATIQAVAVTTNPPVSGTAQQNLLATPVWLAVPVTYNPTSGAAATCEVDVGTSNNPPAQSTDTWPANGPAGIIQTVRFRVPAGWFWRLVTVNATIGTAVGVAEL